MGMIAMAAQAWVKWAGGLMLALLAAGLSPRAAAQVSDFAATKHVEVRLVPESRAVPAKGGEITIALVQKIIPGWHTYWRNAGDSGEPTKIAWRLPKGFGAREIEWPYPKRIPIGPLANFGFETEVWLLTRIETPDGLEPGSMTTIEADVSWLVCQEICIPQDAKLRLELDVERRAEPNPDFKDAFAAARARLPESPPLPARYAVREGKLSLAIDVPDTLRKAPVTFFPDTPGFIKNAAEQAHAHEGQALVLHIPGGSKVRIPEEAAKIDRISGVLVFADVAGKERAVTILAEPGEVPLEPKPQPVASPAAPPDADLSGTSGPGPVPPDTGTTFFGALGFALLGGLILNLMPCVFPVLSMKALALVQQGEVSRARAAMDGLAYLAGVLVTFCALAAAVIVLRSAGEAVGWGFQLQSPFIVAVLAYVLFAVGLNLSGVFQIGGGLMALGNVGHGEDNSFFSAFLTGILAVVVAAPCTVPFMGAAVGYALTQSNALTFLIFIALGVGLALPWLVFSLVPGLMRLVPRPGAWMETFKQVLAFPMYASAVWLVWVLSQQTDTTGLFRVLMGFVAIAFAAWAFGRLQMGGRSVVLALAASAGLGVSLVLIAAPALPPPPQLASAVRQDSGGGPSYEPYTPARLEALLAEGKPVFVNLTAAWCITCLFNEEVAIGTLKTKDAFSASGAIYLKGDWTNRDPAITELLRAHGRDGVPLYLYYPPGRKTPEILPQVLTETLIAETLRNTR